MLETVRHQAGIETRQIHQTRYGKWDSQIPSHASKGQTDNRQTMTSPNAQTKDRRHKERNGKLVKSKAHFCSNSSERKWGDILSG